jgi:GT2 family glycosyltransferase
VSVGVSVIVPVRDGAASLPALLKSLRDQTLEHDRYEVIVVDNGSRDASASVARNAGASVLAEPVPNRCLARNRGVAAASGERLAFIDADCVADPGWLEAMSRCAGTAPLTAGPVRVTHGEPPNAVERFESLWRFSQEDWVKEGWAVTANLSVSRVAFDAVGGFDPAYRHYAEDADFCLRAGRAGFGIGFCADAAVSHYAESELRPMLRRAFYHGYGATQALRRVGFGHHAWRHPAPAVHTAGAMALMGVRQDLIRPGDHRLMGHLARAAYAARVVGSAWAVARRVR